MNGYGDLGNVELLHVSIILFKFAGRLNEQTQVKKASRMAPRVSDGVAGRGTLSSQLGLIDTQKEFGMDSEALVSTIILSAMMSTIFLLEKSNDFR